LTQRADSTSAIPPGRRTPEGVARAEHSPPGDICYVAPDGRASRVAGDLLFPNGLCVSPDGRSLIVAETGTGRVLSYAIGRNGTLDSRNTLIELGLESGLDGMAFDADGRLLIAGCGSGTIYVLAPDLTGVQHTLVGEDPALTNLCSGREDFKTLFATQGASGDPLARPWNGPFLKRSQAFHSGPIHASRPLMPARIGDHCSHFAGYGLTALRGLMVEATGPKELPHHRLSTVVSSAPTPASAARVRSRASLSPSAWTGWIQT
jgi:hypothetical protein